MVTIAVGSAFRNSSKQYVERYMRQVSQLATSAQYHGNNVRIIAVEGDSTNDTRVLLLSAAYDFDLDLQLITCNHNGPVYGSVDTVERMSALSEVGNSIFDGVDDDDDFLVYVESDLEWSAETIMSLLDQARRDSNSVICPMVFAGGLFYDVWAFRKNGVRFSPFPPYHSELNSDAVTDLDSAGSCLVMSAHIARQIRIENGNALVGWCDNARLHGYSIKLIPSLRVHHPC